MRVHHSDKYFKIWDNLEHRQMITPVHTSSPNGRFHKNNIGESCLVPNTLRYDDFGVCLINWSIEIAVLYEQKVLQQILTEDLSKFIQNSTFIFGSNQFAHTRDVSSVHNDAYRWIAHVGSRARNIRVHKMRYDMEYHFKISQEKAIQTLTKLTSNNVFSLDMSQLAERVEHSFSA